MNVFVTILVVFHVYGVSEHQITITFYLPIHRQSNYFDFACPRASPRYSLIMDARTMYVAPKLTPGMPLLLPNLVN